MQGRGKVPLELSIVIAAHNAEAVIGAALTALCERTRAEATEIIVADSSTDGTQALVRKFPRVRLMHFDEPLPIHELRGRAIAEAKGEVVAVLDPFSLVSAQWESALLEAHRKVAAPAIGGAVDFAQRPEALALAWDAYLNEYGQFMPPVDGGSVGILPGCNVSYKRSALFDGDRPRFPVFWKTFVNEGALSSGEPLWLEPGAEVSLLKPVPFGAYLTSRFTHGRCFGGMRSAEWSVGRRLLYGAGSTLLPWVFTLRLVRAFWKKGTHRARFLSSLPVQWLLFGVWSLGEGCGYLLGAGTSCRRLFF